MLLNWAPSPIETIRLLSRPQCSAPMVWDGEAETAPVRHEAPIRMVRDEGITEAESVKFTV